MTSKMTTPGVGETVNYGLLDSGYLVFSFDSYWISKFVFKHVLFITFKVC